MLFLFRSAPEVEKRIHSKLFRKFWRSRGTKEPAYITVIVVHYQYLSSLSQANIAIVLTNSFEPVSDHDFKKNALPSFHTLLTLPTIYTVDNSQGYFFFSHKEKYAARVT